MSLYPSFTVQKTAPTPKALPAPRAMPTMPTIHHHHHTDSRLRVGPRATDRPNCLQRVPEHTKSPDCPMSTRFPHQQRGRPCPSPVRVRRRRRRPQQKPIISLLRPATRTDPTHGAIVSGNETETGTGTGTGTETETEPTEPTETPRQCGAGPPPSAVREPRVLAISSRPTTSRRRPRKTRGRDQDRRRSGIRSVTVNDGTIENATEIVNGTRSGIEAIANGKGRGIESGCRDGMGVTSVGIEAAGDDEVIEGSASLVAIERWRNAWDSDRMALRMSRCGRRPLLGPAQCLLETRKMTLFLSSFLWFAMFLWYDLSLHKPSCNIVYRLADDSSLSRFAALLLHWLYQADHVSIAVRLHCRNVFRHPYHTQHPLTIPCHQPRSQCLLEHI